MPRVLLDLGFRSIEICRVLGLSCIEICRVSGLLSIEICTVLGLPSIELCRGLVFCRFCCFQGYGEQY